MSQMLHADNDQNQFLSVEMSYETCPFCQRSFFRGKLVLHLKLCKQECPMAKNNKTNTIHKKNALSAVNSYQRCTKCQTRIPSYLIKKHEQNCVNGSRPNQIHSRQNLQEKKNNKSHEITNQTAYLPKINKNRNRMSESNNQDQKISKKINFMPIQVKVRDQLRCFRRAEEVQKVNCDNCGRKFSQKASLRHIPICASLKLKQKKELVSLRSTKNYINPTLKMRSTRIGNTNPTKINSTSFINNTNNNTESLIDILCPQNKIPDQKEEVKEIKQIKEIKEENLQNEVKNQIIQIRENQCESSNLEESQNLLRQQLSRNQNNNQRSVITPLKQSKKQQQSQNI